MNQTDMKEAFEKTVQNNLGRIHYIAMRYCGQQDKEDLVQEILIQLWRSFESFEQKSSISTWLYRVALNTAMSFSRKHGNQFDHVSLEDKHQAQIVHNGCSADILEQYMKALNDNDAALLILYMDDLSISEIADILGVSNNATSARISRIKQFLESSFIGGEE